MWCLGKAEHPSTRAAIGGTWNNQPCPGRLTEFVSPSSGWQGHWERIELWSTATEARQNIASDLRHHHFQSTET